MQGINRTAYRPGESFEEKRPRHRIAEHLAAHNEDQESTEHG
jgi:hypothetical protein